MTLPRWRSRILGASVAALLLIAPATAPALAQGHGQGNSSPAAEYRQADSGPAEFEPAGSTQADSGQADPGHADSDSRPADYGQAEPDPEGSSPEGAETRRRQVLEEEERAEEREHGEEEEHTHDDEEYAGGSRGVTFEAFQALEPGMSLAAINAIVGSEPTINDDLGQAFDQEAPGPSSDQKAGRGNGPGGHGAVANTTEGAHTKTDKPAVDGPGQRLIATWPAQASGSICVTFEQGKATMLSVWGLRPSKLVTSGHQLGITTHARRCLYIGMRLGDACSVIGAEPTHLSPGASALAHATHAHSPAHASSLTDLQHTQWQAHNGSLIALVHSVDGEVLAITSTV